MDKIGGGGVFPSFTRHVIHWRVVRIDQEDQIMQENLIPFISGYESAKSAGQLNPTTKMSHVGQ